MHSRTNADSTNWDLVVIGAGPAGLMAAISAVESNTHDDARGVLKVLIVEKMAKAGLKLLASGGGRCNISNTLKTDDMALRFGAAASFVKSALKKFTSTDLRDFFAQLAVKTHAPDGFHIFPTDHSARSVQQALLRRAARLGIDIQLDSEVKQLQIEAGQIKGLLLQDKSQIKTRAVIVATGGRGFSNLGGGRSGFSIVEQAGHKISELLPGMLPLHTKERWPAQCTAHTLGHAIVRIPGAAKNPKQANIEIQGDIIFTKTGLAGPLILDIAAEISGRLRRQLEVPIAICPSKNAQPEHWQSLIAQDIDFAQKRAQKAPPDAQPVRKKMHSTSEAWVIAQKIPKPLARVICRQAQIAPDFALVDLSPKQQQALSASLCWLPLTITGHGGFAKAMVTRGGVSLNQVDRHSMASRVVKGLFFAGEALDVDGPCGGFNLQWAFSSGRMAGLSAKRDLRARALNIINI